VADPAHLALLQQGVGVWNAWRAKEPSIDPDLSSAHLDEMDLKRADLTNTKLCRAKLRRTKLRAALFGEADLTGADLSESTLQGANFWQANLSSAVLDGADLSRAIFVDAELSGAKLVNCRIHGMGAWNVHLSPSTEQKDLIITAPGEPEITVDHIEVAQFLYLLLHNEKIRDVIDTVTSKVVLILGSFTPERKAVLDAIREELRQRAYVPILFDFDIPAGRDITETVTLLARMARFIVADLTDPGSIPKELEAIVPQLAIPVQPLLEFGRPYAMFKDDWKYDWVLPVHYYESLTLLLATLAEKVIAPAEKKMSDLADKRRRFEAELIRPR
jgi:hypothetical protein